jgi:hypothetical protein
MKCQDRGTSRCFEYDPRLEAHHQFSFARAPEPQKADSSVSGLDDGGVGPMAALSFKFSMSSKGGARHVAERFSAVCARCTSGRRCTPSIVATDVGGGGSGALGGGMGGGLRSVRRDLKSAIARNSQYQISVGRPGKARHRKRVPAYRIVDVPPVLPLRECPPTVLLEANT